MTKQIKSVKINFEKQGEKTVPTTISVQHEGEYLITYDCDISAWDVAPELKRFIEALEPYLKESY